MELQIIQIMRKAPKDWTTKEIATIRKFTQPLSLKTYNEMTLSERRDVAMLFKLYFSHSDIRERTIAYFVIMGGIPMSKISSLRLCTPDNPIAQTLRQGARGLDLTLNRTIALDDAKITLSVELSETLWEYLIEFRGLKLGPLFFHLRRAKGSNDVMLPAISTDCVSRMFTRASTTLGLGKARKLQYIHRLSQDMEYNRD